MRINNKYYVTKGLILLYSILSVILFMICSCNLYSQKITIDGNKFHVYGKEIFINGVNTPWDNWNDFGGNYDHNFWNTEFQEIRQAGGNASRIWITCNGDVGINISTAGLVSGATTAHWEDLDDMFALAEEHQVYIMATLTSFDHTKNTYLKYQLWRNMLADTANVSSYVNNYVIPFINRYKNNPYLWCVDICNEIEWMHEDFVCGNIAWEKLQYFAARVAAAVHENSDVLVTLGSAAVKWNSDSPGCEGNFWSDQSLQAQYNSPQAFLDFYSPHFYGWVVRWFGNFAVDKTPDDYGINDRPCMVGENPATGVYTQNSSGQNVLVVPISEAFIKTYQQGWRGLMVWTSNGVDGNGSLADCGVGLTAFQNQYPDLVSPSPPIITEYDSITDTRDGQVYKVAKINNRWWMAENLNYKTPGSVYYNNDSITYHSDGRLYYWEDAINACPPGWHVPPDSMWQYLIDIFGGDSEAYLHLIEGGTTGLNFTLSGIRNSGISFELIDTIGTYWSLTEYDQSNAYVRTFLSDKLYGSLPEINREIYGKNTSGISVRCISDPCMLEGIALSKTDITCFGRSDGFINLSVSGTGTFDFKWSTGDTIQNIQNLDKGWHKVMVTDSAGCSMIDSIEILEPEQLVLQSDYSEYICPGTTDGYIHLNPSGGVPSYTYYWSNGKKNQNISNLPQGIYSVIVKDRNNCQISDSFKIQVILPYDNQEICLVTFDPQTGKNLIIWEKTPDAGIISFNIYRENNLIGTSEFKSPGYFIDTEVNPATRSYLYKISITDTCGYVSNMSSPHKTMLLQQTEGLNEINLNWSKYEGFEVQKYNIWRGSDINNMSIIDSVNGEADMYTDLSPLAGTNIYQLEAVSHHACNPDTMGTTYSSSFSYLPGSPEGINNTSWINTINISPNPFNEYTILTFDNPFCYPYRLNITDLSGKLCRTTDDIETSEYVLERGDLIQGFYFIELRGNNIYRGRIIIE